MRNRASIAIITGGTQGLGLAIAKRLALEGAHGIVISGRDAEKGEEAAGGVRSAGADCLFVKADISVADDCYLSWFSVKWKIGAVSLTTRSNSIWLGTVV